MKTTWLAAISLVSTFTFGQCIKCTSMEEAMKDPEKVISIKLNPYGDNATDEVPETIGNFPSLKELLITDMELGFVPKGIGKLSTLRVLGLAGNNLETLPEEIFQLKNLEELILFSNAFPEDYKAKLEKKVKEQLPKTILRID